MPALHWAESGEGGHGGLRRRIPVVQLPVPCLRQRFALSCAPFLLPGTAAGCRSAAGELSQFCGQPDAGGGGRPDSIFRDCGAGAGFWGVPEGEEGGVGGCWGEGGGAGGVSAGAGFMDLGGSLALGDCAGRRLGSYPLGGGAYDPFVACRVQISTSSNNSGTSACHPNFSVMRLRMISLASISPWVTYPRSGFRGPSSSQARFSL